MELSSPKGISSILLSMASQLWETIGKSHDLVSVLCRDFLLDEVIRSVNQLLLIEGADLPNNRRSIFVCGECGDISCGAITAVVTRQGDRISWSDFGYENNYDEKRLFC